VLPKGNVLTTGKELVAAVLQMLNNLKFHCAQSALCAIRWVVG
jgi:hypothetical protein